MPLRINKICVYQVELALDKAYRVSGGRLYVDKMDSTIVSVETNEGILGWGEGCPFGNVYLPAFAGGIRAGIAELAPVLLGENPLYTDQINQLMDRALPGHEYVKSALDMACWDILGHYTGLPLYTLLGGRFSADVSLLGVFPTGTPEEMLADMRTVREKGYAIFSAKLGADVALDIERIRAVLSDLRPGEQLTIDANRSWLPDQAIRVMNAFDDARLYFEQPCETLEECKIVRRFTSHPLILDECIHTFQDLLWAQREGVAQGIGLKTGRVGGLTKARRMRDFCVATGLRMNIEETGGSVIAATAAIHLALATPSTHRLATSDSTALHAVVTADGGYRFKSGKAIPLEKPGLGIAPRMEVLGEPIAVYS